jgi:spermidine synthase
VARVCAPVNQNVLENPKVSIAIADAREVLLTTPHRYDLIFSEPSNPYRAGIASLFTQEFYQAAHARLQPGGQFIQWLQAYEIDGAAARTVYATLQSVFGSVESWQTNVGDLALIASSEERSLDVAALSQRIGQEPYRSALMAAWRMHSVEGVLAHYVANPAFSRAMAQSAGAYAVNTDDRNILEFALARAIGRPQSFGVRTLRAAALLRGESQPTLTGGSVDWTRVQDVYVQFGMVNTHEPLLFELPGMTEPQLLRRSALEAWLRNRPRQAIEQWARQPEPPRTAIELLVVADAYAALGSDDAEHFVESLRAWLPTEALAITAKLAFAKNDLALALLPEGKK